MILRKSPIFSSEIYDSIRDCVGLRVPAYCMDAVGLYSNKQLDYVCHMAHAEADSTMSAQRLKSFQDTACSPCMCYTVNGKLGASGKPLDLQHLHTQSCSVCVLKASCFKAHLHCVSFIKLTRISTGTFCQCSRYLIVCSKQYRVRTKSSVLGCFCLICFFYPSSKYV